MGDPRLTADCLAAVPLSLAGAPDNDSCCLDNHKEVEAVLAGKPTNQLSHQQHNFKPQGGKEASLRLPATVIIVKIKY